MPSLQTALAFFAVSALLALSPGPDNVFVLLQSAMRGPRAGMLVVLGLCSGLVVHTAAVALGLAAVFAASTAAFTALKWIGAAYLLYLAWQAFRAPVGVGGLGGAGGTGEGSESGKSGKSGEGGEGGAAAPGSPMYWRGVVMNLTNPKVVIFFLAFLPQFADPARGPIAPQLLALGAIFILATLLVFGAIALGSGLFGTLLQRSARARRALNWLAATVFVALAARLATAQR
jgi:threonine/homoserine/homoserine lactone efflux protein